ncbi:hypothetical protein Tco_0752086 [Tanacetum coccineum]|uniref:Uncharacterized protein n=1 Tax=Tanacetum coccineum TaxID=301880 RepID=A0ABQ4Z5Z8_9ASTR
MFKHDCMFQEADLSILFVHGLQEFGSSIRKQVRGNPTCLVQTRRMNFISSMTKSGKQSTNTIWQDDYKAQWLWQEQEGMRSD